ncbi:TniQ family protein [Lentibacillus sediminis]|uniref:TniQ family protein n=1 Tax=Lentibacillus sediminis TaxID=1940529 RepID=UPI00130427EE|nr:TniQ family protein [Lentibacillus sediminis]
MFNNVYEMYNLIPSEKQDDDLITTFLYSLNPIMNEGKDVESLSSYLIRLANAHKVSVGILTSKILKEYLRAHKLKYATNIYLAHSSHINGLGEFSEINVKILEKLTGQRKLSNLTLIKFREVFSKKKLMKTTRAWCPDCLQLMKENSLPLYEKLIWNINHYDVCVKHSTFLKTTCAQCGMLQNIIHVKSSIGYCQYCFSWLGEIKRDSDDNFENRFEESIYNSEQIEEMFNYFFNSIKVQSEPRISSLNFINNKLRENSALKDFSLTKLDITQDSLLAYGVGKTMPEINMLLKISRFLEVSFVEILNGQVKKVSLKNINDQSKIVHYNHKSHYEKVKKYLEDVIESQNDYISIISLSERLNVSRITLSSRFPELINKIKENNNKINQNFKKKRYKYNHKNDNIRVSNYLKKVLNSKEVQTIEEITFELGVCSATLKKYFPKLMKEIKSENKKLRKESTKNNKGRPLPKYKELDIKRIQEKLKAISESKLEEPKYLYQIEKELGIPHFRLRRHFPELIKLISAKNKDIEDRNRKKYFDKCNEELINTITYLVSKDIYPSLTTLQKHLSFKFNNPFFTVWRDTLKELGIDRKSFVKVSEFE